MDLLTAGPERVRPPRRRWVAAVVMLVVAALAVVLAARSNPDRRQATPTPAPTASPLPPLSAVVAVAVGSRWAYALVARCQTNTVCGWDLHRRERADSRWFPTSLRTTPRESGGLGPLLYAHGDRVTVVDQPDTGVVWVSPDGGTTVETRRFQPAPPVDAVPADGVLDLTLCESCGRRLTVLSPSDGGLHPLTTQPPIGPDGLLGVAVAGATIWVVSNGVRGEALTAVSADSGRSWRSVPARGFPTGTNNMQVSVGPGGAAYLLGARVSPAGPGPLAEVWRVDGPTGSWRKLPVPQGPRGPVAVVADGADAVLTDYLGQVWRLRPDATVSQLPDATLGGRIVGPGVVRSGPDGLLVGLPLDELREVVVVSTDRGRSWTVETVAG